MCATSRVAAHKLLSPVNAIWLHSPGTGRAKNFKELLEQDPRSGITHYVTFCVVEALAESMGPILLTGLAIGLICGLARLTIWAVIMATILFFIIIAGDGRITGLGITAIVSAFCVGTTFLQLFYFIGSLLSQVQTLPVFAPQPAQSEFVRSVQSAIGQEMRMSLALPVELPSQLDVRVKQLQARYG